MTRTVDRYVAVARTRIGVSALLVIASVAIHYLAYRLQVANPGSAPIAALKWFDVNSERNVPTAWSALLLLACVVVAASLALRRRDADRGWLLVGATAGYLALDESLELHERLGPIGAAVTGNALHFAWVVPGALAAAIAGALLVVRLRRNRGRSAGVSRWLGRCT